MRECQTSSAKLTSALCSTSSLATSKWPFWAAIWRPVTPFCRARSGGDREVQVGGGGRVQAEKKPWSYYQKKGP